MIDTLVELLAKDDLFGMLVEEIGQACFDPSEFG